MNLTKLSLRRPVSTMLIVLALAVFGISSIFGFKLELQPDMEMPMLLVVTTYPGADRASVEELVTKEIETAGSTMSGVDSYTSMVSDSYTVTMFSYDYDIDIDDAYFDLRAALDTLVTKLPDDAADPYIMELAMDSMDTLTISATAMGDIDLLGYIESEVVPEFETLLGVADVNVYGGEEDYIRVRLDENAMNQYGLNISKIAQYIAAVDFNVPSGTLAQGNQDVSVSASAKTKTISEIKNIPLTTATGSLITLADVADITQGSKSSDSVSRYNGQENISIGIQKKQSEGTVNVSSDVKKTLNKIQAKNDSVEFGIVYDASDLIVSSLTTIAETLALGVILSMLVLFLFFGDLKASLIVGTSMPISLLVTLVAMSVAGFSLNIVTMGGLIIAIGMMVDNSIVTIESCFKLKEKCADFKEAALEGTKIITGSIVASTITTVVVYLPLSVMNGLAGQLFAQLGFTIIFAMLASLISALTLVPLFFSKYKPIEKKGLRINKMLDKVGKWYDKNLRRVLRHNVIAVITAVVLLVLSISILYFTNMELMPSIDEGVVALNAEFRSGTKLTYIDESIQFLEQMTAEDENIESYTLTINGNTATINAYIKQDSPLSTSDMIEKWNEELADVTNMDITLSSGGSGMGSMMTMDTEIDIVGNDLETLKAASKQVEDVMRSTDGVIKVTNDFSASTTRGEIKIDPLKAMSVGYTPIQVAMSINNIVSGVEATTIKNEGEEYSVMLEYPEGSYDDLNSLMTLPLTTPMGTSVVLSDIATLEYTDSPQSLTRVNGTYQIALTASTTKAKRFEAADAIQEKVEALQFPEGVSLSESMMQEMIGEEFGAIIKAIFIAVFLVFLVMAMQFESPIFSGIVMLSVPFSLIGSFGLLFISGSTLSMVSLMGILMLVGIVVNNGILYVDTANMLRAEMSIEDALVQSGRLRLRPILMTTLTTILSMLPMGLGIGDGGKMMQGMALIIIGGLITSTVLILILLPSFYLIVYRSKERRQEKKKEKELLLGK